MSSARNRPFGLWTKLTLWSSLVLAVSLAAGFAWVHHGLAGVLEARDDAFLERKADELVAALAGGAAESRASLDAEIRREVAAYEDDGLIIAVREPGRIAATPNESTARRLAESPPAVGTPTTVQVVPQGGRFRVLATPPDDEGLSLVLAISLDETEATLAAFDRRAAWGAVAFLALAVVGGLFLSRQALRPVTESIAAARRLDPANLSERLPLTGAGDELDELAGTINGLLDRLAAYHTQVIRFTADASHELRSPLAAMRAAVEVALQQPRDEAAYRDVLASLGEQCERLTALVNGLLLLAQADAGEVVVGRDVVDLSSLAEDAAEMYEPLAEERRLAFRWECAPGTQVAGDALRLRQLVTNLLDNAMKFTPPGGSVRLAVRRDGGEAMLSVADTGGGISSEHLPHVFERFYRADPARPSSGTGLGLSICRWIVEAHGGTISVESRPGAGTTFRVTLR
ncbi:heavy metal sensor histidine kinase [Paludisphaera rhizosphaerae]|uniref:heavy metal sensor histidine kinase n=1 Tax=Paludisphaera rhizosphaerae TaxID=2711216 RepID=UPI0013ED9DE9|nr:heavy metal sensor histidine kinase [Paludisphaera rhizosphaerae]